MDVLALMGISYILGMCFQYYVWKKVAKIFKDDPIPSDLDGLRK